MACMTTVVCNNGGDQKHHDLKLWIAHSIMLLLLLSLMTNIPIRKWFFRDFNFLCRNSICMNRNIFIGQLYAKLYLASWLMWFSKYIISRFFCAFYTRVKIHILISISTKNWQFFHISRHKCLFRRLRRGIK